VQARGIVLDEVVSARTFHIATALVRQGVGLTVVDNFTAQASLAPGLSMRPLANPLRFDVHAMYLHDRPPTALATTFLKALARKVEAISS
ncbi:MAG: LysR family transcriptional regulator, partial [Sphingomonadales bacterium]